MSKLLSKLFLLSLFTTFSVPAEQIYGVAGTHLELKNSYGRVNAFSGLAGYKLGHRNFTLTPQFRYIKGNKTTVKSGRAEAEFDDAAIFGFKAQYTFDLGLYVFSTPSYGVVNYFDGYWVSREWREEGAGINLGFGYEFYDLISTEIYYDEFSEFKALNAGISIQF
ncbi:hypothetical protein [Thalassotalea mangrovi]|uniref:Porin family protein n=1 Tax=Thalassotalea mangrovi TaxID=2572245 RepID=A0A4U1B5V7_9GAMM|nr:hypothetical protein [Thalassotalea mangrovi]TKB45518.1 hypothetical protein E8M12_07900 [Thalassotalea mangrovi]